MSGKMKIEWVHEGFEQILCSDGARQVCEEIATEIQGKANADLTSEDSPGFAMGGKITWAYGSKRWMYFVHTTDRATMLAEQYDQVLSKAVN